ncbi:polysaccharide deacetylase family protein [Abditibacterium utsteinense]|nr:polysaccharide deacetylase family protein [Abditibacterium utsteinense]
MVTPRATFNATPVARRRATPARARSASGKGQPFHTKDAIYSVDTSQKVFALTFDDGPDPNYTPQVLALLKRYQVPATFFMVGSMVRAHPATALQVLAAGFPIENHSWSHPRAPKAPLSEVQRTDAILKSTLGIAPTLFRPPYGLLHNGLADAAQKRGEKVIIWSCLGADWDKKNTPAEIAAKVLRHAHPGGIALLHDGGGNRSRTLSALPLIIETLQKRGFRLVTVPQLLQMGAPAATSARTPVPIPAPTFSPDAKSVLSQISNQKIKNQSG